MQQEIFLVEELENRLAIEAVQYMHKIDEEWLTHDFDPAYFDTFISGPLYGEFVQAIYDRIKPLNSHEANRFLTLSVAQFKTHVPERREKNFILNYWHTKWYPNAMDDNVSEQDEKYAKHVWMHYTSHFYTFKEATEKGLEDLKAGFLGSQPAPVKANGTATEPLKYEAFNQFIKQFEYNYPYKSTAFNFKYNTKTYLGYLKNEILDNIIMLNSDSRKPYLNRLKNELQNNKQYTYTTQATIDQWLTKYNIESEEKIKLGKTNNELFSILTTEAPKFDAEFDENFNKDTRDIQTDFYNFYYGFYLDAAINFINEQINEHSPTPINSTDSKQMPPQPLPPKLKTNLTVPQLAYLFKMLMDINPPIFDIKSNKELYQFIEANFTTKGKVYAGPTVAKLNNLYSDVDKSTGNFWAEKLAKMLQDARKI